MEHTHDHPHAHDHMYPHSHTCSGQNAAAGKAEETKALLTYMIHHNEHHNFEFTEYLLPAQTSPAAPDSPSTNIPTAPSSGHQSPSDACGSKYGS